MSRRRPAGARRRRRPLLGAAVIAAVAAWLAQGVIAFTHADGHRVVMLPVSLGAGILVIGIAVGVALLVRAGASRAPLALLAFLFLPWIPGDIPAIFFLWRGRLTLLLWASVVVLMVASALGRRSSTPAVMPGRPALIAGLVAVAIFTISAWQVSPSIPAGDEPHYLVITQSLLRDGDLRIENNHRRGDYQAYHTGPLPPDFRRRGRDGQIYSIHAPGLSALVAPAFAIGGYSAVVLFLILVAAAGSALAWRLAFAATGRADAAWFAWAAVTLPATSIFHSFSVFPDGPAGVLVLSAVWALLRSEQERNDGVTAVRPWLLHGCALAALPWLHTRFAVLAGTLGALILLRVAATRNAAAKAVAFLAVPAFSAVCWIGYFVAIYGTPDPAVPYAGEAGSFAFVPGGVAGLLFDQRFGLLAYAPVLAAGFVGLGLMLRQRRYARLALEMLFVIVPYLLTVTHFAMWWGGYSAPARFAAPIVLLLAVPAAMSWASATHTVTRVTALAALGFTAFASSVLVFADGGRLAYNSVREPAALWLARINEVADLPGGLPLWSRTTDLPLFRDVAAWVAALGMAWVLVRWGVPRVFPGLAQHSTRTATLTLVVYVMATMAAVGVVWRARRSEGIAVASAQVAMLRFISRSPPVFAFDVNARRPVSRDNVPGRLRIEFARELPSRDTLRGAARDLRAPSRDVLFAIPVLPAGEYRISPVVAEQRGWLMVGVGRDQFALLTAPVATLSAGFDLRLSAHVRELVIRGDEEARTVVRGLTVEPLSVLPRNLQASGALASRAVRYGTATVFFVDHRAFAEPEGFWVAGGERSAVLIHSEERDSDLELHLRNAPVENRVRLDAGAWREELTLRPDEERRVRVPLDSSRDATLLHLSSSLGFRPSAVDPNSRDERYLGVWVRVAPSTSSAAPVEPQQR